MKDFTVVVTLAAICVLANASFLAGGVKDVDVTRVDKETTEILRKTLNFVNNKHPQLSVPLDVAPQLIKRTRQVVAGIKSTFTFKIPVNNNSTYLYYAEVWNAPWMNANNQIIKACVLDLSGSLQSCSTGDECRNLVRAKGKCSI